MILISIDNGQRYEDSRTDPAILCVDWNQARAAEKEFNAWHQRLRVFFKETTPDHNMTLDEKLACNDSRRAWLKKNPPPFWVPGGWPEAYSGSGLCDCSVDLAEIPGYTPKEAL